MGRKAGLAGRPQGWNVNVTRRLQSNFHLYVVSAFRRTRHGPAKAGHYVQDESALGLAVAADLKVHTTFCNALSIPSVRCVPCYFAGLFVQFTDTTIGALALSMAVLSRNRPSRETAYCG